MRPRRPVPSGARGLSVRILGAVALLQLAQPGLSFLPSPGGVALALAWPCSCARLQPRCAARGAHRRHVRGAGVRMAWEEFFDENYNVPYYYNSQTGETTWEKPAVEKPKVGGGTRTVFRQGAAGAAPTSAAPKRGGTRLVSPGKASASSSAPGAASPDADEVQGPTKTLGQGRNRLGIGGLFGRGGTASLFGGSGANGNVFDDGPRTSLSPARPPTTPPPA